MVCESQVLRFVVRPLMPALSRRVWPGFDALPEAKLKKSMLRVPQQQYGRAALPPINVCLVRALQACG